MSSGHWWSIGVRRRGGRVAGPWRVSAVAAVVTVLLAVVSAGCAATDEDRIRHTLEEVAQTVSIEDRETPLIRQARAVRLTSYLTHDATVDVGAPFSPVAGHDAVALAAAAVRVPAGGIAVEFSELRVTVEAETRRALATATASLAAGPEVGGEFLQARELEMVFSEVGGEWLIEQVRFVGFR
jgi:hypothetical protein